MRKTFSRTDRGVGPKEVSRRCIGGVQTQFGNGSRADNIDLWGVWVIACNVSFEIAGWSSFHRQVNVYISVTTILQDDIVHSPPSQEAVRVLELR